MKTRILVVDDEPALTRMVKLNLEQSGRFVVRTENEGARAVQAARGFKPDLILLDVMMPDMTGDEVSQELAQDSQLSSIKIIFMTAIVTKAETGDTGKKIGGNEFVAKPVKAADLIATIDRVLGET